MENYFGGPKYSRHVSICLVDREVAQFRGLEQSSMSKGIKSHGAIGKDVKGNLKKTIYIKLLRPENFLKKKRKEEKW